MKPYCFVITSFDKKQNLKDLQAKYEAKNVTDPVQKIDFDIIYEKLVKPAIIEAGLEPLIEKQEKDFGSIYKTMFEKIILCEFCIADLTNMNPNAYFELGMRYAVRPYSTIPIIASSHFPMPFDVLVNRTFAYQVDKDFNLSNLDADIKTLAEILTNARQDRSTDSPLYDMVNGISFQNSVAHEKTDVFRDKVVYDKTIKDQLAYARNASDGNPANDKATRIAAIDKVVAENLPLSEVETGVIIDMMISYRNIEAFDEMKAFIEKMPRYVFNTVLVREQYAFVLNRNGGKANPVDDVMIGNAESVLKQLEADGKASSETYGIWGRIYKDKFDRAYKKNDMGEARTHLKKALEYYKKGFEFDPRDAYPGINYATCLELSGKREEALRLVPAVEYAVKSKMKRKDHDYWDYATLLELAIIENKFDTAEDFFYEAKPLATEVWMKTTTKYNLEKIINFRKQRGEEISGIEKIVGLLG